MPIPRAFIFFNGSGAFVANRFTTARKKWLGFSERLSDDGTLTGRGPPFLPRTITGFATFVGGILHTLPFLLAGWLSAVPDLRGGWFRAVSDLLYPLPLFQHELSPLCPASRSRRRPRLPPVFSSEAHREALRVNPRIQPTAVANRTDRGRGL